MAPQPVPRASETSSCSQQGVGRQSSFCVPSKQGWGDEEHCDTESGTAAAASGAVGWEGAAVTQSHSTPE